MASQVTCRLRAAVLAGLLALAGAGCGSGTRDGDPDTLTDGDTPRRGTITITAADPLQLYLRQRVTIEGTYTDQAGLPDSVYVEASLQGTAHDTTLDATTVRSSDDGSFAFTLTAAEVDTDFVFRVEAEDGASDEIDVEVRRGDESVTLDATYEGRRMIEHFETALSSGEVIDCPDLDGETVATHTTEDDGLPFEITGLPESTAMSLSLSGVWCEAPPACHRWVHACADGVLLEAGVDEGLTLALTDDLDFFAAPYFDVVMEIDAGPSADAWVVVLLGPLTEMTADGDDPAHHLLDGIYDRIVTQFGTSQGDLFVGTRLASNLDSQVNSRLVSEGADPAGDFAALRSDLVDRLRPCLLEGVLEGDFWGEVEAVNEIEKLCGAFTIDILEYTTAGEVTVSYASDIVTLGTYSLPMGLGESLIGIIEEVSLPVLVARPPAVLLEDFVRDSIPCDTVAGAIMDDPTAASIPPSDPETWYTNACNQVLDEAAQAVRDQATDMDATHRELNLSGQCDFLLVDGTGRTDRSCVGTLSSVSWGDTDLTGEHVLRLEVPE